MTLRIEGRGDGLLEQERAERHTVILNFLNQFIFGQIFDDMDAIQAVLATWPEWSAGKAEDIHRFHEEMEINPSRMSIWAGESPGGEFTIGFIKEDEDKE